jgi:hypothetical protein
VRACLLRLTTPALGLSRCASASGWWHGAQGRSVRGTMLTRRAAPRAARRTAARDAGCPSPAATCAARRARYALRELQLAAGRRHGADSRPLDLRLVRISLFASARQRPAPVQKPRRGLSDAVGRGAARATPWAAARLVCARWPRRRPTARGGKLTPSPQLAALP